MYDADNEEGILKLMQPDWYACIRNKNYNFLIEQTVCISRFGRMYKSVLKQKHLPSEQYLSNS